MIPVTADDETLERYVDNCVKAWMFSSKNQRDRAVVWYPTAHDLAAFIADGDVRTGAGLLAALSANKSWDINRRLAADAARGNLHGHFSDALNKAQRILEGEDPLIVLPVDSKTWNFYRAIVDPADPDSVVIDRHVHDAIVGETLGSANRGLSNKKRYALLALVVRLAARRLGVTPNVLQALLWIVQTDKTRGLPGRPKNQGLWNNP